MTYEDNGYKYSAKIELEFLLKKQAEELKNITALTKEMK